MLFFTTLVSMCDAIENVKTVDVICFQAQRQVVSPPIPAMRSKGSDNSSVIIASFISVSSVSHTRWDIPCIMHFTFCHFFCHINF